MKKYIKHFITITKHKFVVMSWCFKMGIFWRGITHDLSKYSLIEFFSSAKYFQGSQSPINAEKKIRGYSLAWQHHKGHNPHHWEYWIDNVGTKQNNPIKIPYKYVIEMFCDFVGAGKIYSKNKWTSQEPLNYHNRVKHQRIIHHSSLTLLELLLTQLSLLGEKKFVKWYRKNKRSFCEDYKLSFDEKEEAV